jgi:NADPH:quinone reductase-like Zn-dependent oxidoreductase
LIFYNIRQGLYSPAPKYPYIPGFEASGTVEAVGLNVSQLAVGDRIVAFAGDGMWADFVTLPSNQCFKMPEKMSFEEGAALLVNYITAYQILFEFGNLRPNKSVLIHMAAGKENENKIFPWIFNVIYRWRWYCRYSIM